MDDLKTKIKIKTLDLLVIVAIKASQNKDQIKNILMGKLNQVYYEMYSEKLIKEMKNYEKQTSGGNVSTDESNMGSVRGNRATTLINKRYSKGKFRFIYSQCRKHHIYLFAKR